MKKPGITSDKIKEKLMKDEEFKKEYEKLKPRYELISEIIKLRNENNMTQAERLRKK